jgi:hypothetical protein
MMTLADAVVTYRALLQLPVGGVCRLRAQGDMCAMRDHIAELTGLPPQEVHEKIEAEAREMVLMAKFRYDGESLTEKP